MKSTALSIGGEQVGNLAKELETAGNILTDSNSSESDKQKAEEFINNNQKKVMKIYDELVDECKKYLGLNAEGSGLSDENINLELQKAFDNENWILYSILIDQMENVDKNLKIACQMATSEITSAIKYIKANHSKLIE